MDYFFLGDENQEATEHPMIVMTDESTHHRYARAVTKKGVPEDGENGWLIKDMADELKSWGHPGGGDNKLILKCDSEPAILALRRAVATYHGGVVTPDGPPVGEKQGGAGTPVQVAK